MYAPDAPFARRDTGFPGSLPFDGLELARIARTDACILFTGPADVRPLAVKIHSLSGWRWGPFLTVDCSRPDHVLEEQLFSVIESDGSVRDDLPRVRLLQAGTIFLHEVGKLSRAAQMRLHDVLGDTSDRGRPLSRRRLMASSSETLLPRVANGTFDDRLFYRLNVLHFVF